MNENQQSPVSPSTDSFLPVNKWARLAVWVTAVILATAFLGSTLLKLGDFILHLDKPLPPFQLDFAAFYTAAAVLNSDTATLYDDEITGAEALEIFGTRVTLPPYIYPPFFAWLLRPLAMVTYQFGVIGWFVVNLILAVLILKPLGKTANLPATLPVLLGLFCLVWFFPLTGITVFSVGQVNLLMLFLLVVIAANTSPGISPRSQLVADLLAGIAIGLATGIKLFFGVLIPYFWFYQRKRVAVIGTITFALTLLVGILGAGFENTRLFFLQVLPRLGAVSETLKLYSYSIFPAIERMFITNRISRGLFFAQTPIEITVPPLINNPDLGRFLGIVISVIFFVAILVFLVLDWYSNRNNSQVKHDLRISSIILGVMLLLQLSWAHSFVLALLPIAILLSPYRRWRLAWWKRFTVVVLASGLILFDLHWNYIYYLLGWEYLPFWALFTGTLGILVLVAVLVFELRSDRPGEPEQSTSTEMVKEGKPSSFFL